jgi:2-dehydro-3-deoxyphosphogalactonate aldolase
MSEAQSRWSQSLRELPLVAILRGLQPGEAVAVGQALCDAGWSLIEVPLNSPQPLQSIEALARALPKALVGAGTVLRGEDIAGIERAGGRLIVSPDANVEVISEAAGRGLASVPGVSTPTEAFSALRAGATALKLFPAEMIPPQAVKAMRAVLPRDVALLPVGGIAPDTMAGYLAAGASGFGIGSALFKPGMTPQQVHAQALAFAAAWRSAASKGAAS